MTNNKTKQAKFAFGETVYAISDNYGGQCINKIEIELIYTDNGIDFLYQHFDDGYSEYKERDLFSTKEQATTALCEKHLECQKNFFKKEDQSFLAATHNHKDKIRKIQETIASIENGDFESKLLESLKMDG